MVIEVKWKTEKTQYNEECQFLGRCVYGQSSALVGGKFFVYGGYAPGIGTIDCFYILDLSTKKWQAIAWQLRAPLGTRSLHSMHLVDDKIYIHGGRVRGIHHFDIIGLEVNEVKEKFTAAVSPVMTERWGSSLEFHERSNTMLMFGGASSADVLSFDLDSKTWDVMVARGTPPQPRTRHTSCIVEDDMYIYGGMPTGLGSGYFNDLCVLSVWPRPAWSKLIENHGIGRFGASLTYVCGRLMIYGGRTPHGHVQGRAGLVVFNPRSKLVLHEQDMLVDKELEPRIFHSAIVRGNEILMIGGRCSLENTVPELGMISSVSLSF